MGHQMPKKNQSKWDRASNRLRQPESTHSFSPNPTVAPLTISEWIGFLRSFWKEKEKSTFENLL